MTGKAWTIVFVAALVAMSTVMPAAAQEPDSAPGEVDPSAPAQPVAPDALALQPLPEKGAPAPIAAPPVGQDRTKAYQHSEREIEREIRRIRYRYLGAKKNDSVRQRGFEKLAEFTDPIAVAPLVEVLRDEGEDVRAWLFEHLTTRIDPEYGQAALAYLAIFDEEESMRRGALAHLEGPATARTKWIIDQALRSKDHEVANFAGLAAGRLKLIEAIPLLITAQAASSDRDSAGDLAFIAVQTQRFFVSDLQPVVGENSAGFDPELSPLREGTLVRIQDAVVHFYRWDVHNALVDLVKHETGRDIDFGFNEREWRRWYNHEYLGSRRP